MSDSGITKHDQILFGLTLSLQAATMQHLGKIANPLTGKVERDLEQARGTIDILEMLKVKCRTDTPEEVLRALDTAVMELQMNYLDEFRKDQDADESAAQNADEDAEDNGGDGHEDVGEASDPDAEDAADPAPDDDSPERQDG